MFLMNGDFGKFEFSASKTKLPKVFLILKERKDEKGGEKFWKIKRNYT